MSRMSNLVSRPRRTLAALATVLVAVGITAASGADFTATSANPSEHVRRRHADHRQLQGGRRDLHRLEPAPGRPRHDGTVDIKNTGSLAGTFTLTRTALGDSDRRQPAVRQAQRRS